MHAQLHAPAACSLLVRVMHPSNWAIYTCLLLLVHTAAYWQSIVLAALVCIRRVNDTH
jgi:hypothetical protein